MSKPKTIQEIIDLLPEESRASASDFIAEQIRAKSEEFEKESKAKEEALKEAQARSEKLAKDLDSVKSTLEEMAKKSEAKEAELMFNERMSALHEEFELSEADLKIVVEEIRGLNEESYANWYNKFSVLAESKKKSVIAEKQKEFENKLAEAKAEAEKKSAEAKTETSTASAAEDTDSEANIDKLEEEKAQALANAAPAEESNKLRNWGEAFSKTLSIDGKKITK